MREEENVLNVNKKFLDHGGKELLNENGD